MISGTDGQTTYLDILITVFDEEIKHGRGWLSKMILARGDEHVYRSFDFFDEFLTFSFDVI
jgi:hypothetical protein